MNSKPNDFKIGVFVIVGVVILLAALFVFGASKWFEGKTIQETYVDGNVDGLKVGAPVTLRGVPVGQVTRINFTWNVYHRTEPRYVYIEFEVDKKVSLAPSGLQYAELVQDEVKKGLRARIKTQGLAAGTSIVSLEYVKPEDHPAIQVPWTPRHIYIPSAPGQLSEIMSGLNKTIAAIKEINFAKIATLVESDLHAGGALLTNAEMTVRGVGTNVNQLVGDVRGVAAQLREFATTANEWSGSDLQKISQRADALLGELHSAVARLDKVLANLDVASLNETLENFRRASQDLQETVAHVKQYPAGALLGQPPPPARSVERTQP